MEIIDPPPPFGPVPDADPIPPPPPPEPITDSPRFHGTGAEYFGIWIVNILLTIVTLGIYLPWARVRTRRYFYENTKLFDAPFDYLADPTRILIGYLIVGGMYLAYSTAGAFFPILAIFIGLAFFAIFPWFIFKAHRFFAANSAYRNVPMRFEGTVGAAYATYMGYPILAGLTLWILMPLVLFKQKEYFFNNFQFGHLRSRFWGNTGYFFKIYLGGAAIIFGVGVLGMLLAGLVTAAAAGVAMPADEPVPQGPMLLPMLMVFVIYGGFIVYILVAKGFIQNHCWNHTDLSDEVRFQSALNPWKYAWIQISNVIATVFTLGFFIPWAKVRLHRYVCDCMAVTVAGETDLETLTGQAYENVTAVGDSAAEFLDIDFGF